MTESSQSAQNGFGLKGNLIGMFVSIGLVFVFSKSCHASATWDNMNPFSPGFLKAADVAEEVERWSEIARNARLNGNDPKTVCDAYLKIADAYNRLSYEGKLAQTYRDQAKAYCP